MSNPDQKNIKIMILSTLGVAALWDILTTIIGTYQISSSPSGFAIAGSAVLGLFIMTILSMTFWIFGKREEEADFVLYFFRGIWGLCLFYDLFTSWNGNINLIFGGHLDAVQYTIVIGLTVFMSFAPIAWMYVYQKY